MYFFTYLELSEDEGEEFQVRDDPVEVDLWEREVAQDSQHLHTHLLLPLHLLALQHLAQLRQEGLQGAGQQVGRGRGSKLEVHRLEGNGAANWLEGGVAANWKGVGK